MQLKSIPFLSSVSGSWDWIVSQKKCCSILCFPTQTNEERVVGFSLNPWLDIDCSPTYQCMTGPAECEIKCYLGSELPARGRKRWESLETLKESLFSVIKIDDGSAQPHPWSSSCDWSITWGRDTAQILPSLPKLWTETPSHFTHLFGNQWATSLWKLRHLGKLVFGYVTVKLLIHHDTEMLSSVLTAC